MNNKSGYNEQQKLSLTQVLTELPDFLALLVSAILSKSLIVLLDVLDSFGIILRNTTVALLSKKLSRNLKFEYNYGIGKIEAISALLCDSILFFGLFLTLCLSVREIISPSKPSDLLIAVVGLKIINVCFDSYFFIKQRKIAKQHTSAISNSSHAAAFSSLLFDCVALFSLLLIWLLRDNPISGYISPIISIAIALYLMVGCIKRIKIALDEITDKTLPEDTQLKILSVMSQFYKRYAQFYAVKSRKNGDHIDIDLHISFENDTTFEEIIRVKQDVQKALETALENCSVNIVVQENEQ